MKAHNFSRYIKLNISSAALYGLLTLFNPCTVAAQAPPPPPPGYGHGSDGNQKPGEGGDAPLGTGLALLIGFSGIYAFSKYHRKPK